MEVHILASGSKGNCTLISTKKHKILIDIGMNLKYIEEKLAEVNVNPADIEAILISHVHDDHISALKQFVKKYSPIVYMSAIMFKELPSIKGYDHIMIYDDNILLEDLKINTIKTSHDTKDSRAFIVTGEETSVVYMTDTGYINSRYFEVLKDKTIYLMESNYDVKTLMNGRYPSWLKARVYSSKGHLSNIDASVYLTKLVGKNTEKIVLMHLSENNNTEELALTTIRETFELHSIKFKNFACAKQKESLKVKWKKKLPSI